MGTKRSNWTVSTLQVSDQNASDSNHQRRDRPGRDPSPRIGMKVQGERERERNREEEWRREKEMERMRGRKWDGERETGPSHREKERYTVTTSRGREGEREKKFREVRRIGVNGKVTVAEGRQEGRERESEREKGGTFPRMRKTSRERHARAGRGTDREAERAMMKRLERQRGMELEEGESEKKTKRDLHREGERDMQRYREMERERLREHKRNGGEQREKDGDKWRERQKDFDPRLRERRREEWEGKDRGSEKDMDKEREKSKHRQREGEFNAPQTKRITEKERENFSDRVGWDERWKEWRREGWRDTKSEGDSDGEKEKGSGRESGKIKLRHKHSKSEGDSEGEKKREKLREKERCREVERCREREKERGVERDREWDRKGEREMEKEIMRSREKERQKEREMEREDARYRDKVRQREAERDIERRRDRGMEREKVEREIDRCKDRDGKRREERERQSRTRGEKERKREEVQSHKTRERVTFTEGERVREREWYPERVDEERHYRPEDKQRVRETGNIGERGRRRGSGSQWEKPIKAHSSEELKSESDEESDKKCKGEKAPETWSATGSNRACEADLTTERFGEGEGERQENLQGDQESERAMEMPEHRHKPRKMWLEPRQVREKREEDKYREMESVTERHTARYLEGNVQEGHQMRWREEERCVEKGEVETVGHWEEEEGVSVDSDREGMSVDSDKEGESERFMQSGTAFYEDRELLSDGGRDRSVGDSESEQSWQGDGDACTERETFTDSNEESDREVERVSDNNTYPESGGESQREGGGDRDRVLSGEDGFITVSSGGEEEEEFEDCKDFWEGEVATDIARKPSEFQKAARQIEGCGGTEKIEAKMLDGKGVDNMNRKREEVGEGEGTHEGERREVTDQEKSLNAEREKESVDTETGRETVKDGKEEESEEGEGTRSTVTVFCVIGQTLPRKQSNQERFQDQVELEEMNINVELDTDVSTGITDILPIDKLTGISRDRELEEIGKNIESGQSAKEKETEEERKEKVDEVCMLKEESRENNPIIYVSEVGTENNEIEEHMTEVAAGTCSRNSEREESGIVRPAENEKETETRQDANKEPQPCSEMITESSGEGEFGRRAGTEYYSGTKQDDKREREPTTQTHGNLSKAEELRKDSAPYIKWARDVVREILGSSEDNTLEGTDSQQNGDPNPGMHQVPDTQTGQPTDGGNGSLVSVTDQKNPGTPVFAETPADSERDEPVYAQVQKKRDRHPVPPSGTEAQTHMQTNRQMEFDSYTNTRIHVQTGTGGDEWAAMGQGDESDSEADLDSYLSLTKVSLSKSNSCPSPVKSTYPTIMPPEIASVRKGEYEKEGVGGEIESTSSFRDQGNKARVRRRGFRKTLERGKEEEEEGEARDRRTRVFNLSEEDDELSYSWSEVELRNVTDSIGKMKKRNSKFFNSQLYQQYSEVAQNRDILRQSRSDTLSMCEELPVHSSASPVPSPPPARRPLPPLPPVPHPHSLSHSNSFSNTSALSLPLPPLPCPPSPRLSVSLSQSPTLWQDLPGVRNSQGLTELGEEERRLQEVRFEVVTSEASYCRSLDIVIEHFVNSKELGTLLTTQERNWLFSRLGDVRAISHSFLAKLEERVENDIMQFSVCDIIVRHCPRFRLVYVPYLTNQSYQDKTYQRLMEECAGFRRVVEKLERSPICQRLPLRSFLILPFQRITRLKLLVQNIVKRTTPNTEEEVQAIKALKLLEKLIQEGNDSITQMKSIESLVSLSARVDFECKTLPLVSQSRRMVREGTVTELRDFALKEAERTLYLHLFNDYLLLSLRKDSGRFLVVDHAPVSELRVENCRVKLHSLQKNLFRLHLSNKALLVRTDTQSDKLRWMSALSRPHPPIDYTAAQDINQVQCIRAFVAQQPDELNLDKADVLLVHQQSSDGWIEGTKLSDRQRGWAPDSHLETIVSERARQRNLLDTHKITRITATY